VGREISLRATCPHCLRVWDNEFELLNYVVGELQQDVDCPKCGAHLRVKFHLHPVVERVETVGGIGLPAVVPLAPPGME